MARDWTGQLKDVVQEHVAEPVVAADVLQPAGAWAAFGLQHASALAGFAGRKRANQRAGGVGKQGMFNSKQALLALTADKLYAFNAAPRGTTWKVKEQVGVWRRADLAVATEDKKMTTLVTLEVLSTGQRIELEATTVGSSARRMHDEFLGELTKKPRG
jgi:hypothetical protein